MKQLYDYKTADWQNINVLQKNRLAPRPFYCGWPSAEGALAGDKGASGNWKSLNGTWEFAFFESPLVLPEGIASPEFSSTAFSTIRVPAHWQFEGFGHPHYTDNIALIPLTREHVLQYDNPTGVYRRTLALTPQPGEEYLLRFDGVESAYHLYINGRQAGYSQGSRYTAEFDVTPHLHSGENTIVVVVYQFCEGSALEKQDMWTLAGIIRDVSLITRPTLHLADYTLRAGLEADWQTGTFYLEATVANHSGQAAEVEVEAMVLDGGRECFRLKAGASAEAKGSAVLKLEANPGKVEPWSAEIPRLYQLLLVLRTPGAAPQYHAQKFGYRDIRVKDGLIHINGRYVTFRGMNRHDWAAETGRCVSREEMEKDLLLMKSYNINAVRTAHYPNMPVFYELCDELGLYVVDEADLECNETEYRENLHELSDSPEWQASYLDRTRRLVGRDKNNTCIVIWSIGNESGYGRNFKACYEYCKAKDPTRLVHYEEDREGLAVDMFSSMYTKHADLEALGKRTELDKPHILCEYGHSLGNSTGGLEEYWDIIHRYPRLQGGFVWEWIAHGILATDEEGKQFLRYGGDFGDKPNSGKFCTSGVISPRRQPYPVVWQIKKALEPVKLCFNAAEETLTVKNLFSFLPLLGFRLQCTLLQEGAEADRIEMDMPPVPPLEEGTIAFPLKPEWKTGGGELILDFRVLYKQAPPWAGEEQGMTLTVTQFPLNKPAGLPNLAAAATQSSQSGHHLTLAAEGYSATVDLAAARLCGLAAGGVQMLADSLDLCFWRAPIDNDKNQLPLWEKYLVNTLKNCPLEILEAGTTLVLRKVFAPITRDWRIDTETRLSLLEGRLRVEVSGAPSGVLPPTLPRVGVRFALPKGYTTAAWYGRGPGANYPDAKLGSPVGLYKKSIDELHTSYVVPQENGARSDVRRVCFTGGGLPALGIQCAAPMIFTAGRYADEALEKALHQNELVEDDRVWVHLDWNQHGLGSAGWGPEALENATLCPVPFAFGFDLVVK